MSDNIGTTARLGADGHGDLSSGRGAADFDLNRGSVARRDADGDDHVQQVQAGNFGVVAGRDHGCWDQPPCWAGSDARSMSESVRPYRASPHFFPHGKKPR